MRIVIQVPNPLRISPQTHVLCGWRRVHISIRTCPCINSFYMLWLCLLCYHSSMFWQLLFVFFNRFECLLFDQSSHTFVSKIQKHIKSRKSKKFDRHYYVLSHTCLALYLRIALCIYKLSLFFLHLYHCGKNLDIYVTVVNRSSNLLWMICE